MEVFYYENDNVVELLGLTDAITDAKLDNRIVKITITDDAGTEVTGQTWPLTLTAEGGSTGNYRAILKDSIGVTVGKEYFGAITVHEATDLQATFNIRIRVIERGST